MNLGDNLQIIEKETDLPYNILLESRLSKSLTIKTLFSCVPVSNLILIVNHNLHINLIQKAIVEGDD